jgi:hypothetical protein
MKGQLKNITIIIAAIIILLSGCAKIETPPGGPIDKTGPTVISMTPSDQAVGIAKGEKVTIQFSENVDHKSVEQAIFISPRLLKAPKYKWHDRVLEIIMPDTLNDSTTYVINIGSNASDLRNNKMANSQIFAFSTGGSIAAGKINGTILQSGKTAPGVSIGLFEKWSTTFDSIYPPFLTQSGNSGEYALQYLPDGQYFILAFDDKNKNNLFDYASEPYGLPDRIPSLDVASRLTEINFLMTKPQDTSRVLFIAIVVTPDHLIRARLSRSIAISRIYNNLDKVFLVKSDSISGGVNPSGIIEKESDTLSNVTLYFDPINEGQFQLRIDTEITGYINDSTPFLESSPFAIKLEPDQEPPRLDNILMTAATIYPDDSIITLQFSEPIDRKSTSDSLVSIIRDDSTQIDFILRWIDQSKGRIFIPGLEWDGKYKINVSQKYLIDMSGNTGLDSVKSLAFKTYNKDSLGTVSGSIKFASGIDSSGIIDLIFSAADNKSVFHRYSRNISFNYPLPPGKYMLRGYIDRNGNGQYDYGSLFPLSLAETVFVYPDTVRVRSRFETAGIELYFR